MKYITTVNGETFEIEINQDNEIIVNGEPRQVDFQSMQNAVYSLILDNSSHEAVVEDRDDLYHVLISGDLFEVSVIDERTHRLLSAAGTALGGADGESVVTSPMPGMIVAVPVEEGQEVQSGETVVILESMKMENELKAPIDGVISRVHVAAGDSVEQNKALITVSAVDEEEA